MPVGLVLRDILKIAENRREAKQIVHSGHVSVDGIVANSIGRGVGLMDVLTVGEANFRCVLDENGRLRYREISAKAAATKPCRIENKTTVSGGRTQLNLHDGRNILIDDAKKYSTGDTLVIDVKSQKVKSHHKLEPGAAIYLIGGGHVGLTSTLEELVIKRSTMPNEVKLDGYGAIVDHVFVLGSLKDLPLEVTE
jgi:small subunit ribosomal protein S4e